MSKDLKGKQIDNNTITQENFKISYSSIVNNEDVTNKQYVDDYINQKVKEINFALLNQNMNALNTYSTLSGVSSDVFNQITNIDNNTYNLKQIISTENNTLYLLSDQDIIKSINSGNSWNTTGSLSSLIYSGILYSMTATDNNTLYAVGDDTEELIIIKSTNAGNSWVRLTTPSNLGGFLYSIISTDNNTLYVVGTDTSDNSPLILKTINAGNSWTRLSVSSAFIDAGFLHSIISTDNNTLYVVGYDDINSPLILKTTDAGNTWIQLTYINSIINRGTLNTIISTNSNTLYCTGYESDDNYPLILKSIDAGNTWERLTTPNLESMLYTIYAIDSNTIYTVGQNMTTAQSLLLKSIDAGNSWNQITLSNLLPLKSILFMKNNGLFTIGNNVILKSNLTYNSALACDKYVIEFPISDVHVKVNGVEVNIGDKVSPYDGYFSNDNGITVSTKTSKADYLYWNPTATFQLDEEDEIDFEYLVNYHYLPAMGGSSYTYDNTFGNMVIRYTGDSGTTSSISISSITYIFGNVNGQFVFDIGGTYEHAFTYVGESIIIDIDGIDYEIMWDGFGSLIWSIVQLKANADFGFDINIGSTNRTFTLPLLSGYNYNFKVYWDSNTPVTVTSYGDLNATKTFPTSGIKTIYIKGICEAFDTSTIADASKIIGLNWFSGDMKLKKLSFANCTNLSSITFASIPKLNNITNFDNLFNNCRILSTIPNTLFNLNNQILSFNNTFNNCRLLNNLSSNLFRYNTNVTSFENTFTNCYALTNISTLFDYNINVTSFNGCFSNCTSLTTIPNQLFYYNSNVVNYSNLFSNCKSINLPEYLFNLNNLTIVSDFSYFMYNTELSNSNLGNIQPIWLYASNNSVSSNVAFYNQTGLTNYSDIPNVWKYPKTIGLVTTESVINITTNSFTMYGLVTVTGGDLVTRGFVWSTTNSVPTLSDNVIIDSGNGIGEYSFNLSGLTSHTTYYVRAFVTNTAGNNYGDVVNVMTSSVLTIPTITTTSASLIASNSATTGGIVTSDGNSTVTARGVVFSTSTNPTLTDSVVYAGTGTGSFVATISGLTANTTYYVRAFATNGAGTAYGTQVTFTSAMALAALTTTSASLIASNSATTGGNVTTDNNSTVTARGVVFSTTANPTLANSVVYVGTGTGSFVATISGLTANTTYYVRAFATNGAGTAYGTQTSFTSAAPAIVAPTVITNSASTIGSESVAIGGNVTSDGGSSVYAKGVVYSTTTNPTISNSHTLDGIGTGSFISVITGLTANTTYYIRAYATNSGGTSYGTQITITTTNVLDDFVFKINVNAGDTFTLPLLEMNDLSEAYNYNFTVQWDSEGTNTVTSYNDTDASHTFATAGVKTIRLNGTCEAFDTNWTSAAYYITEIVSFNSDMGLKKLSFATCTSLTKVVSLPYFTKLTDLSHCFEGCAKLSNVPSTLFDFCINITNFSYCFSGCTSPIKYPDNLFKNAIKANDFSCCFSYNFDQDYFFMNGTYNASAMTYIPLLFGDTVRYNDINFSHCFEYNLAISAITSSDLFRYCLGTNNFEGTFYNVGLYSLPENLFTYNSSTTSYVDCFYGCPSLYQLPNNLFTNNINVTDFSNCFCYCTALSAITTNIFKGCINATNFSNCFSYSALSAITTNIFVDCINATNFSGCFTYSKLTIIPTDLFTYTTNVTSFEYCFNTTLLKTIPENLFKNNTYVTTFNECFSDCYNLTQLPNSLFSTNTNATFVNCFEYCSSLTAITSTLFSGCSNIVDLNGCFNRCIVLKTIPQDLFKDCINVTNFSYTFQWCENLTTIPQDLFRYNTNALYFEGTFENCRAMSAITSGIFNYNVNATSFKGTFSSCYALTTIPTNLFKNNIKVNTFYGCFSYCTSLRVLPNYLFYYNSAVTQYNEVFYNCRNIALGTGTTIFNTSYLSIVTDFSGFMQAEISDYSNTGTIQDIWTYAPSAGHANCFLAQFYLTNYSSIPSAWKVYS